MKKPLVISDARKASIDRMYDMSQGMPPDPSRYWRVIPKKAISLPDYIEGNAKN